MQGTPRQIVAIRRGTSVHIPKEDEVVVVEALLLVLLRLLLLMVMCVFIYTALQGV
jgi:hypothetical protein